MSRYESASCESYWRGDGPAEKRANCDSTSHSKLTKTEGE